jgi:hypothetical protein
MLYRKRLLDDIHVHFSPDNFDASLAGQFCRPRLGIYGIYGIGFGHELADQEHPNLGDPTPEC